MPATTAAERARAHGDQARYTDGLAVQHEVVGSFKVTWTDIPQLDGTYEIYLQLSKEQDEYVWSDEEESDGEESSEEESDGEESDGEESDGEESDNEEAGGSEMVFTTCQACRRKRQCSYDKAGDAYCLVCWEAWDASGSDE